MIEINGWCSLGDKYALVMKFVDHVFDDQVIDRLTLKIILPEGSTYETDFHSRSISLCSKKIQHVIIIMLA